MKTDSKKEDIKYIKSNMINKNKNKEKSNENKKINDKMNMTNK